jgi:hypothetical protein
MVVVSYGIVYWSITTYQDDEEDDSFKQTIRSQSPIQVKVLNLDADSFAITNPMDSASSNSPESSKKLSKESSNKLSKKSSKHRDTNTDKADSFSVANPIVTS